MGEQSKMREPQLARTDFESMTHEQLAALLDSASSDDASHLATKLSKAASTITKIGDDLMKHVKGLEWVGEGGDTFRDWGGQTASATLHLGQYAEVASRWMGTVSQAIAEAKAAMPATSETTQAQADLADAHKTITAANAPGARNDPDARKLAQTAQTDATAAQGRIDAARAEAVQQMRKLAQTYEYSAQQVNSVTPPTFSPPAGNTGSSSWWRDDGKDRVAAGSQSAGGGAPVSTALATQGGGTTHVAVPKVSHAAIEPSTSGIDSQHGHQSRPVSMGIDGTDTLPHTSTPPSTPTLPQTGLPHREVSLPGQPSILPPAFSKGGRDPGMPSPSRVPSPSRLPQVPRTGLPNGSMPRMPRETGIMGGRPVTSNPGRSTNGIPRGTVIGKEDGQGRTPQGRTPMGRGMVPGGPAEGGAGSRSGVAGGRRLASEAGGVVGNRPAQPGRTGGRPFTPGGSGLVRPSSNAADPAHGSVTGRTGAAAQSSSSRNNHQRGDRPDYLVEDEETWARDNRRHLPPVVD